MKFGNTSSPLILTLLASSLLVACNDSGSDPKLASTAKPVTPKTAVSGVALDGYLNNAKVCIDINRDLSCDSADGESVFTNEKGQYTLLSDGVDLSQYAVIVEVIPQKTIDMDTPNATLDRAYVLSAPADSASLITPYTTVISAIASQQGLDYNAAKVVMSKQLGVDASAFERDYVAKDHADDPKLHLLAQSLTRIMQKGEQASVEDGVARLDVRKGVTAKLALLDLASLKTKTDKLVGTANDRNAIDKIADDYVADVTVSTEEVVGNEVLIIPPAPDSNSIKDAADTFDWSWVGHFRDKTDYEYSVDKGQTWQPVTAKPLSVGKKAYAIGDVQVRTKGNANKKLKAGKPSLSTQAFTLTLNPAAPNSISVDDANNTFDWDFVATIEELTRYEYSLDSGATWQTIEHKPQSIHDIDLAVGALQVRLAEFGNSSAGLVARSTQAFSVTPDSPSGPRINVVDDNNDIFGWDLVDGFVKASDYEVYLNGTWETASANPLSVGNNDYSANSIKVRVAADANNGRPAGAETKVTTAFTKLQDKPVAPTNGKVDDANNLFDWDNLTGFVDVADYQISLDGGVVWNAIANKPASIPDDEYAAGKVCVRVTENAQDRHPVGDSLCSLAKFTETPATPLAPTAPVTDDSASTFAWTWVEDFDNASDYEISIQGSEWKSVTANPIVLAELNYAIGQIQVRVAQNLTSGNNLAGAVLSNRQAFTQVARDYRDVLRQNGVDVRWLGIDPDYSFDLDDYEHLDDLCDQSAQKIVDDNSSTKFLLFTNKVTINFTLPDTAIIDKYSIVSAEDYHERDPLQWTLEASTDGISWQELDARKDQDFTEYFQSNEYVIDKAQRGDYRYYRFLELTNNSSDIIQLADIKLWAYEPLVAPSNDINRLENGIAEYPISGARCSKTYYYIDVPVNAAELTVTTGGGTGDVDIYVLFNELPTQSDSDCGENEGTDEVCSLHDFKAGRYQILMRGYTAYDDVSLTATYKIN
ncbi:pre-peptidase C-terminal domain-containing protein [Moritella sp.]|uniref:pre-peptidase C-terminal domain-containing protein n=1 Tax=Moritella sp. TaxID=78556 RepID=UPI0025D402CE|nr:pre-peptidase C-terminal domain-containing protein [Moritella sp.]